MTNNNLIIGMTLYTFVIILIIISAKFFQFNPIFTIGTVVGACLVYGLQYIAKYISEKNPLLISNNESDKQNIK